MDLNNGAKLLYSNFGNLQKSNSEKLPEVSDYFDSNPATPVKDIPATPVKDIGAPIKDTQIVTVAMNLSDILETIDVVEDTNRENIVPSSCSLVNNNLLSRGNGSPEPTLSTNIEENQSKQLGKGKGEGEGEGEGDTEGEDAIYNVKRLLISS